MILAKIFYAVILLDHGGVQPESSCFFGHHPTYEFYFLTAQYIRLTNRVRGPYRKLRTKFFPLRFMAQAPSARAINRKGKNKDT